MNDNLMNRRAFICRNGAACLGMLLAGCAGTASPSQKDPVSDNYYLRNKKAIVKELRAFTDALWLVTSEKYDKATADSLVDGAEADFEAMLAEIPYIGGDDNSLTENLYMSVWGLAFYRRMQSDGKTVEETGELFYRGTDRMISGSIIAGMSGRSGGSDLATAEWKKAARKSQEHEYPDDWVFEFIPGKGSDFDYGIDYTECGICKYYKAHKAEELIPYMCILDFPMSRATATGLVRTQTLGEGGTKCNFRYKQGRPIQMEWVPDFLKKEEDNK